MKKIISTVLVALLAMPVSTQAQRVVENLDRGLVAVSTGSEVFCSWRVLSEEYYDVTYNIYRDGVKLNDTPLTVSNYTDTSGSADSKYTVKAVVRGTEQSESAAVTPLTTNYKEIKVATVPSNADGTDISSVYEPNDAIVADLDGDGEMEILIKMRNTTDAANDYPTDATDYDIIQIYKQDGRLMWWIDCGRNMVDFQSNEINIAAYDWDQDGKAECILRGADGMVIHQANGETYTVGDASVNTRGDLVHSSAMQFTHTGAEYLVYLNGETGVPYSVSEYPLKRLESGETNLESAWGDGYGHRSSKNFFGAPYLDGRKPSIFLARGIYTRHKMIAYDVDPATHALTERWRWSCNESGSIWYGQGYHNYSIADVDWDGRDEIVFGSMVIDDNGKGLSSTGLGHGDAHHVGDLNPYEHGQEVAACNEDRPSNNFRDATTSKIYYRLAGGSDDGRCIAGNFTNDYPGAQFTSAHDYENLVSCVAYERIAGTGSSYVSQNFRIYWDGDLLDETFNGSETRNSAGVINKYGTGRIAAFGGTYTNNDTKSTPCFQGDIFGDWREEIILRASNNHSFRIYTTTIPTEHRIYTLLHDPQYRNAMITQMNGYNQPPHPSFFLGEMEGITAAPPAPNMNGKTEVKNGGSISSDLNDKQVMLAETADATISIADGAAPYIFFDNAPTWVQGSGSNDNITTTTYTHTLTGGAFTGSMRLVKLGDGVLTLPNVTQTYSGATEVWAGVLNFDGEMQNSRVWLNRFAELNSNGGKFPKGIKANYGAVIRPGGASTKGTIETDSLILGFGSIAEFDVFSDASSDLITAKTLKIETRNWTYGPQYLAPRFNFVSVDGDLAAGTYPIMNVSAIEGDLSSIVLGGLDGHKASLSYADGVVSLVVTELREATTVIWTASEDNTWQLADKSNFKTQAEGAADVFVSGDNVVFNDEAGNGNVEISDVVTPGSITFDNSTLDYTITGDSITGVTSIVKNGEGNVNINNVNTFSGTTTINEGTLTVNNLGLQDGVNIGALGKYTNTIALNGGTLIPSVTMTSGHPVTLGENGGTIDVPSGVTLTQTGSTTGSGNTLTKTGAGTLQHSPTASYSTLIVEEGTLQGQESNSNHGYPTTIILNGGTLSDADDMYSYSTNRANVEVPEGVTASWYLDSRCNYKGTLKGAGTLNIYTRNIRGTIDGNWASFSGTLNIGSSKTGSYDPIFYFNNSNGMRNATIVTNTEVNNSGKSFAIGNLKGSGKLTGSGTWTIGGRDEDITYSGTIDGGKLTKTGDGLWTMSSLQTKVGGQVTVNGGVLNLNNSASTQNFFGSNGVIVSGTGTLAGQALLQSIAVNSGGTLQPGNYTATVPTGALKSSTTIFCYAGSTAKFFIYNARQTALSTTSLSATSTLSIAGDIVVEMYERFTPEEGDTFTLWTARSFTGTPTSITLPELPEGLEWDTSGLLAATGVLTVKSSTGIKNLAADEQFTGDVYTISGVKVGTITTTRNNMSNDIRAIGVGSGVYIIKVKGESVKVTVQ